MKRQVFPRLLGHVSADTRALPGRPRTRPWRFPRVKKVFYSARAQPMLQ